MKWNYQTKRSLAHTRTHPYKWLSARRKGRRRIISGCYLYNKFCTPIHEAADWYLIIQFHPVQKRHVLVLVCKCWRRRCRPTAKKALRWNQLQLWPQQGDANFYCKHAQTHRGIIQMYMQGKLCTQIGQFSAYHCCSFVLLLVVYLSACWQSK